MASQTRYDYIGKRLAALRQQIGRSFHTLTHGGSPQPPRTDHLRWLYAPSLGAFAYALQTCFVALLALGVALWWELGGAHWAVLTVWAFSVQGTSRQNEAITWRHIPGTVLGGAGGIALVGAFPQETFLFFLSLALGMGLLCLSGRVFQGRAGLTGYGFRTASLTFGLVGVDGLTDPTHVFQIAMARATYVVLGATLQNAISGLFELGTGRRARSAMADNFGKVLSSVSDALGRVLAGEAAPFSRARILYPTLVTFSSQADALQINLGNARGHEADHARAALSNIETLLALGQNLSVLLQITPTQEYARFRRVAAEVQSLLHVLPEEACDQDSLARTIARLGALIAAAREEAQAASAKERTLLNAIGDVLAELTQALDHLGAALWPLPHDRFRYRPPVDRDWGRAAATGLRIAATLLGAGLFWYVTAWPDGAHLMMFVCVVCSLFSGDEQAVPGTRSFLAGATCSVLASGMLVLWIVPPVPTFEGLAVCLMPSMMLGALARADPALTPSAVAFNIFTIVLMAPDNQSRLDEITWFNNAMAMLLGLNWTVWMARLAFPFNMATLSRAIRYRVLADLRGLARVKTTPVMTHLVERHVGRFARLLFNADHTTQEAEDAYLRGILAAMTIGLNIVRIREILARGDVPETVRDALEATMVRMARFTGRYGKRYGRTLRATRAAIARIEMLENPRPDVIAALASLRVIAWELELHRRFFDVSAPFEKQATSWTGMMGPGRIPDIAEQA